MVGDPSVVGLVGNLVVATRGECGPGEVAVRIRGGIETFLARSDTPLPRGTSVLVIGSREPRTVEVVPWLDPAAIFGGDF
ncbi:hypothetical protein [Frankia sp. AgB32]|uniref:hypothetical protein n=1 Tax=Frankia sp. AgB32 TaxID=631119 RepID=UPI00200DE025|nr:hypothetical protein [Frankia sp. AgB32]MCK9895777.1 hypothetical protein [Frankia sp. AgB32]